jgi:hypothetical protein
MDNKHTGQGQIIEAKALTQDEHGNWIPAVELAYSPTLWDRIACLFGWHSWRFSLKRIGEVLVVPDMIPDGAVCVKCNQVCNP